MHDSDVEPEETDAEREAREARVKAALTPAKMADRSAHYVLNTTIHKRNCTCDACLLEQRAKDQGINRHDRRKLHAKARKSAKTYLRKKAHNAATANLSVHSDSVAVAPDSTGQEA